MAPHRLQAPGCRLGGWQGVSIPQPFSPCSGHRPPVLPSRLPHLIVMPSSGSHRPPGPGPQCPRWAGLHTGWCCPGGPGPAVPPGGGARASQTGLFTAPVGSGSGQGVPQRAACRSAGGPGTCSDWSPCLELTHLTPGRHLGLSSGTLCEHPLSLEVVQGLLLVWAPSSLCPWTVSSCKFPGAEPWLCPVTHQGPGTTQGQETGFWCCSPYREVNSSEGSPGSTEAEG